MHIYYIHEVVGNVLSWIQISADSNMYRQYFIRFWGTQYNTTQYNTNPIISADISDIDIKNHWPIPTLIPRLNYGSNYYMHY